MRRQTRDEALWTFLTYTFLLLAVLLTIVPLYWMIVAATIPQSAFTSFPPRLIPGTAFLTNFGNLQDRINFVRSIANSAFVAVVYTLLSLVFSSMGGFAFAKYEFKFKEPLFYAILATQILPISLLIIPLFLLISQLNWINTFRAIILPWLANPIAIFLMRQNMKSIPDSLLESARLDGASEMQIFYKIALPTMKSSLAAVAVVLFLFQWNLFLYPLVVLKEQAMFTIPVAFAQITGFQRVYYNQTMVAAVLSIVPFFALFIVLQKQFVSGILAGGLKQ